MLSSSSAEKEKAGGGRGREGKGRKGEEMIEKTGDHLGSARREEERRREKKFVAKIVEHNGTHAGTSNAAARAQTPAHQHRK